MQERGGHLQIQTCLNQNEKSESKDAWYFTGQIYLKSDWREGFSERLAKFYVSMFGQRHCCGEPTGLPASQWN
jgi:hypothetical protein